MIINSTLCYIEKENRYLMLFRNKKEHDPCEGKWVGVGGKFEPGESADECLMREVREETGLHLTSYRCRGIVHFVSDTWPDEDMYLYTADGFEGRDHFRVLDSGTKVPPRRDCSDDSFNCREGELFWVHKEDILSLNLWDGDRFFLEPLMEGKQNIALTCRYEGHKCVEVSGTVT